MPDPSAPLLEQSSHEPINESPEERRRRKRREKHRRALLKHPGKIREQHRRWKQANPEKVREHRRRYAEANREKKSEYERRWRQANREKEREYCRRWDQKRKSLDTVMQSPDKVYGQILSALPSGLPRHVRDDVAGSLCLAILEKKVLVKNIKAEVGNFLKAYNREYDNFETVSLDVLIPGTKTTYLDALVAG